MSCCFVLGCDDGGDGPRRGGCTTRSIEGGGGWNGNQAWQTGVVDRSRARQARRSSHMSFKVVAVLMIMDTTLRTRRARRGDPEENEKVTDHRAPSTSTDDELPTRLPCFFRVNAGGEW